MYFLFKSDFRNIVASFAIRNHIVLHSGSASFFLSFFHNDGLIEVRLKVGKTDLVQLV